MSPVLTEEVRSSIARKEEDDLCGPCKLVFCGEGFKRLVPSNAFNKRHFRLCSVRKWYEIVHTRMFRFVPRGNDNSCRCLHGGTHLILCLVVVVLVVVLLVLLWSVDYDS